MMILDVGIMKLNLLFFKLFIFIWSRLAPKSNSKKLIELLFKVRKKGYPNIKLGEPDNVFYLEENTTLSYWEGTGAKTAMLVHGWNGSGDQFFSLYEKFRELGFSVYVVMPKGYGQSSSVWSNPGCFIKSIESVLNHIDKPINVAVGHSMGAGALLHVAAKKNSFDKLVSVSAPSNFTNILDDFCLQLAVGNKAKQYFFDRVEQEVGISHQALNISSTVNKINHPILFVHDDTDKVLPVANSMILDKSAQHSQLLITQGLGHTRLLNSSLVVENVINFVNA